MWCYINCYAKEVKLYILTISRDKFLSFKVTADSSYFRVVIVRTALMKDRTLTWSYYITYDFISIYCQLRYNKNAIRRTAMWADVDVAGCAWS